MSRGRQQEKLEKTELYRPQKSKALGKKRRRKKNKNKKDFLKKGSGFSYSGGWGSHERALGAG